MGEPDWSYREVRHGPHPQPSQLILPNVSLRAEIWAPASLCEVHFELAYCWHLAGPMGASAANGTLCSHGWFLPDRDMVVPLEKSGM